MLKSQKNATTKDQVNKKTSISHSQTSVSLCTFDFL